MLQPGELLAMSGELVDDDNTMISYESRVYLFVLFSIYLYTYQS